MPSACRAGERRARPGLLLVPAKPAGSLPPHKTALVEWGNGRNLPSCDTCRSSILDRDRDHADRRSITWRFDGWEWQAPQRANQDGCVLPNLWGILSHDGQPDETRDHRRPATEEPGSADARKLGTLTRPVHRGFLSNAPDVPFRRRRAAQPDSGSACCLLLAPRASPRGGVKSRLQRSRWVSVAA